MMVATIVLVSGRKQLVLLPCLQLLWLSMALQKIRPSPYPRRRSFLLPLLPLFLLFLRLPLLLQLHVSMLVPQRHLLSRQRSFEKSLVI